MKIFQKWHCLLIQNEDLKSVGFLVFKEFYFQNFRTGNIFQNSVSSNNFRFFVMNNFFPSEKMRKD